MNYAATVDAVMNVLRENSVALDVDENSINEGRLGELLPPPFIDAYFIPSQRIATDSGTPFAFILQGEIFVGVPSLDSFSASIREAMRIVGKVLTLFEDERGLGIYFDEGTGIEVESRTSDTTVLRLSFKIPFDPYEEIEEP